jgi:hypothetical protein
MKLNLKSILNFFKSKPNNAPPSGGANLHPEPANLDQSELQFKSHTSMALFVIRKHFSNIRTFTSHDLYFFCNLEGFNLTRKQIWRVITKLQTLHFIDKIVLCSTDPNKAPFYQISNKLLNEWTQEN